MLAPLLLRAVNSLGSSTRNVFMNALNRVYFENQKQFNSGLYRESGAVSTETVGIATLDGTVLPVPGPGQVLLFVSACGSVPETALEHYNRWLSPQERQRLLHFRFERHRHEFLLGKALTRYVLAAYTRRRPTQVAFGQNRYGKPELETTTNLRFNLTHSAGVSVLAVSCDGDLGVDVERIEPRRAGLKVAERYFAPLEHQQILACPAQRRVETFFAFWTLKESFIKAEGRGLSLPLHEFAFRLQDTTVRLELSPALQQADRYWHSELLDLGEGFICAWSWRTARGEASATCYRLVPLQGITAMPARRLFSTQASSDGSVVQPRPGVLGLRLPGISGYEGKR